MSHTSVLVTRGDTTGSFKRILVPTDFSPTSERALEVAVSLAADGGSVDLFHTWQYPGGMHGLSSPDQTTGPMGELHDSIVAHNNTRSQEWLTKYTREGVEVAFVQTHGSPSHSVQSRLEDEAGYDLICMGTHGYRGFRRFMLGSVAEATVRHAPCSVLVVRATEGENGD
jgi:nucleotide-binding universal stress UspA family protein